MYRIRLNGNFKIIATANSLEEAISYFEATYGPHFTTVEYKRFHSSDWEVVWSR